jgi:probable F420-dependent oxidoreductase
MDFGIGFFLTDESVDPATLGRMLEERGFESLFVAEHTHIPSGRDTPYPVGGDLPRQYWHTYDPFVALTAVATATERLKLATGICLVAQHDPIVTAKAAASVDHLSGGRFLFGVGAGWNEEEMRDHGIEPRKRFGVMREHVEAIKAIWTQDEAEYHGKHVDFPPMWSWPKPVQQPHPPVLVGGHGKGVIDRVMAYGDEWFPNRIGDDEKIQRRITRLREAGKRTTLANAPTDPATLEAYESAGVHRAIWWLPQDDTERRLDKLAGVVERYRA